ncbi:DinB family protein [Roseivirga pacifica]|uniref:DinB family protein n=1 Tax=Roseivirga pacifica TaxID=1267423 RepID=UPI00227AE54B|nr:DinB family protein [Roseivirga pacifica]
MRIRLFTLLIGLGMSASSFAQSPMTKEERAFAIKYMDEATKGVEQTTKGLSAEQLAYKPDANTWSVEECLKHMAISEETIWAGFVTTALQTAPDPSKRAEVQVEDKMLLGMIESRQQKVQTQAPFEPTNKPEDFKTVMKEFKSLRAEHAKWMKNTDDDLRNRYAQTPVGTIHAYQAVLFISGHVKRHTDQMKEVMASPGFPKQ